MFHYILRRLVLMVPTMLGITLIVVGIMLAAPGEPGQQEMGGATIGEGGGRMVASEGLKKWKEATGFFDADGEKKFFVAAWWSWLTEHLIPLDFGDSTRFHKPVLQLLGERLPITLLLNAIALFLIYWISLPLGVFSAKNAGTKRDGAVTTVLFVLYSMPSWWVATMLIVYFGSVHFVNWFDVDGLHDLGYERYTLFEYLGDSINRLILPIICLTYGGFAYLSRQMRAGMLETVRLDYVRTARAKGLPEKRAVGVHAFRNALIPIITLMGYLLPSMIGGSIIIELIFSIQGMGLLGYDAILNRDYSVVLANTTFAAILTLLGLLFSDVLYCLVDPRISLD